MTRYWLMPNALISVYNKDGIENFANELNKLGWNVYASGGTAKVLDKAGVEVINVADLVGGGAILGHRVVTLSREIYAGLLATDSKEDAGELKKLNIPRIDLVCVDLYPLQDEIKRDGSDEQSVIEQTDIGGPTLLRAAAKGRRIVISHQEQREDVLEWIRSGMPDEQNFLRELASHAEATVAQYALDSARFTSESQYDGEILKRVAAASYGENPWQKNAFLYSNQSADKLAIDKLRLVQGSDPSYNNYCDFDRLLQTMTHITSGFDKNFHKTPFIALGAKHGNVCGAAVGEDREEVIRKMVTGDARAIFGGVVMLNFELNEELAEALLTHALPNGRRLLDGVISSGVTNEATQMLQRKGDKCRLLVNPELSKLGVKSLDSSQRVRYVRGGQIIQDNYTFVLDLSSSDLSRHPTRQETDGNDIETERRDVVLAWAIGSTSNSNTITIVKDGQLLGNGVGQQDRVSACELAIKRSIASGHDISNSVAYSDSFFPFPDGPQVLADAGIDTVFATSGSVNDEKIIEACVSANVSLYMVPDKLGRGFYAH